MIKIEGTFEGVNAKELESSLKEFLKNFFVEGEITIRVKDIKKALFDLIYCQRMSIFDVY